MGKAKYQFKNLFDPGFLETALRVYGLTEVNELPELPEMLSVYETRLHRVRGLSRRPVFGQVYRDKIIIAPENRYNMAWSVAEALKVIKSSGIQPRMFSLNQLYPVVDQTAINRSHLSKALNNKEPIIIARYPPKTKAPRVFVIDGNHRTTSKYEDGQQFIPGYILSPDLHLRAMVTKVHRLLFKIHFNYFKICSYIGGKISEDELKDSLYPL